MDVMQALHGRRSVREFTGDDVETAVVEQLIAAAMAAPSANNGRPWRFIVLRDPALRERVAAIRPGQAPLTRAPLGIVVLAQAAGYAEPWWAVDCSLAVQNLMLAAEDLGLGTVFIGVWPEPTWVAGVSEALGVADGLVPVAIVALGHPARKAGPVDRFEPSWVEWR